MPLAPLERPSPHEEQSRRFEEETLALPAPPVASGLGSAGRFRLKRQIYGWQPHWRESALALHRWELLSTAAYFSYEVDPETGRAETIQRWGSTKLHELARAGGTAVELTATLFGEARHHILFANADAITTLVAELARLAAECDAGVCVDFERVPSDVREPLAAFVEQLRDALGDRKISIALPAVDWTKAFDIERLAAAVDRLVVMAYDYHWRTGSRAGPVSPLSPSRRWGALSVEDSIERFLRQGAPAEKLLLGLPLYGYLWPVESPESPAKTTGAGVARTYAAIRNEQREPPLFDEASQTPYYLLERDDGPAQLWFENVESLRRKCELAEATGLGGVALWALGYDAGYAEIWDMLEEQFLEQIVLS